MIFFTVSAADSRVSAPASARGDGSWHSGVTPGIRRRWRQ